MSPFQQDIARVIGDQLGGLRALSMMLGAKNFVSIDAKLDVVVEPRLGGLRFNMVRMGKSRVNLVQIELQPNDLYRVSVWNQQKGGVCKLVDKANDIFNDQLVDCLEGFLNLSVRMPRIFMKASA